MMSRTRSQRTNAPHRSTWYVVHWTSHRSRSDHVCTPHHPRRLVNPRGTAHSSPKATIKVRAEVFLAVAVALSNTVLIVPHLCCGRRRVRRARTASHTVKVIKVFRYGIPRRARAVRPIPSGRIVARDSDRVGRTVIARKTVRVVAPDVLILATQSIDSSDTHEESQRDSPRRGAGASAVHLNLLHVWGALEFLESLLGLGARRELRGFRDYGRRPHDLSPPNDRRVRPVAGRADQPARHRVPSVSESRSAARGQIHLCVFSRVRGTAHLPVAISAVTTYISVD